MITGLIRDYPTADSLVQWDACWYRSIVERGYVYKANAQCNLAFFPLFPLLWRVCGSPWLISFINLIMLLAGLTLLTGCIHISSRTLLLLLSIPNLFFCYVPYSEASFFFTCSLFIYGWKHDKFYIAVIGMALACLSRSAATVFVPVIVISFILNFRKETLGKDIRKHMVLLMTGISSVMLVHLIQYLQTGSWFKFFETQRYWGREFNWPSLFLTTWGEWHWAWLDGLAFFIGVVCMAGLIYLLIRKVKNPNKTIDPVFLFSMGYLMMAMFVVLFFGPADTNYYGTSVYSINRFVFATPFFAVFFSTFGRYIKFEFRTVVIFLFLANIVGFVFGAFTGIDRCLYWAVTFAYAFLFLWLDHTKWRREIWTALYLINTIFQLWMFNSFIHGGGVL
jgi:hypothetical protein